MNERLRVLRKALDLTQTELGERNGLTVAGISKMEIGERPITDRTIISICQTFNVSRTWLETGIGDMFITADEEVIAMVEDLMEGENEIAKKLFSALARLGDEDWKVIEKLMDYLDETRDQRLSSS